MKFLHCADLHIDSPLAGLTGYEGAPVDEVRGATRRAFERLVEVAIAEEVTAVLVAGDLLDGDRENFDTAIFVNRQFTRLTQAGIRVFVVNGNHDAESKISRRIPPPEGVVVFGSSQAETVVLEELGLCVHGQSYASPRVSENLALGYPVPVAGLCNVGLLHTSMAGREGPHARYAPCTEAELLARGYHYWALGHIHQRYVGEHEGCWVVYPGNLQGRHAREVGPKGASLVTYDADGVIAVQALEFDEVRWELVEVDVSECQDLPAAVAAATAAIDSASAAAGHVVAVRLRLVGRTPLAAALLAGNELLVASVRAGVAANVYLEKVRAEVDLPAAEADEERAVAAASAVSRFVNGVSAEPSLVKQLVSASAVLRSKFPNDLSPLVGYLDGSAESDLALLDAAQRLLVAELGEEARK